MPSSFSLALAVSELCVQKDAVDWLYVNQNHSARQDFGVEDQNRNPAHIARGKLVGNTMHCQWFARSRCSKLIGKDKVIAAAGCFVAGKVVCKAFLM